MNKFTKEEVFWTFLILAVLVFVSVPNFITGFRRSRDVTRKSDLGAISVGLEQYFADFGKFPLSSESGEIIACLNQGEEAVLAKDKKTVVNLVPCSWGKSSLADLTPGGTKVYLGVVPSDPDSAKGVRYMYFSNGNRYQLLTALEGVDEPEYSQKVFARGVYCGTMKCNMARASSDGPVDISVEEWEARVQESLRKKQ